MYTICFFELPCLTFRFLKDAENELARLLASIKIYPDRFMAVVMFVSSYLQEGSLLKCDYFVIFVKCFQFLSLETTHTLPGLFIILKKKQPTERLLIHR